MKNVINFFKSLFGGKTQSEIRQQAQKREVKEKMNFNEGVDGITFGCTTRQIIDKLGRSNERPKYSGEIDEIDEFLCYYKLGITLGFKRNSLIIINIYSGRNEGWGGTKSQKYKFITDVPFSMDSDYNTILKLFGTPLETDKALYAATPWKNLNYGNFNFTFNIATNQIMMFQIKSNEYEHKKQEPKAKAEFAKKEQKILTQSELDAKKQEAKVRAELAQKNQEIKGKAKIAQRERKAKEKAEDLARQKEELNQIVLQNEELFSNIKSYIVHLDIVDIPFLMNFMTPTSTLFKLNILNSALRSVQANLWNYLLSALNLKITDDSKAKITKKVIDNPLYVMEAESFINDKIGKIDVTDLKYKIIGLLVLFSKLAIQNLNNGKTEKQNPEVEKEEEEQLREIVEKMVDLTESTYYQLMSSNNPNLSQISSQLNSSMEELTNQINSISKRVRDDFFSSEEGTELMDKVNAKLSSISMRLDMGV